MAQMKYLNLPLKLHKWGLHVLHWLLYSYLWNPTNRTPKIEYSKIFFLTENSKALLQSYSKHDQVCNSNTPFLVVTCPSYSYYCSDETPWFKKKVWEKGFIWLTPPQHLYINGESQKSSSNRVGTCRHEVMQQPWRYTADWVVPHDFLSPVVVPSTIGWTLLSWSLIKKLPYTQVLLRYVSIEVLFFQVTLTFIK